MPDLDATIQVNGGDQFTLTAKGEIRITITSGDLEGTVIFMGATDALNIRDLLNRQHIPPFKCVDPDKLDDTVLNCIMQNLGWEPDDDEDCTKYADCIKTMSPLEAFDKFLDWQGICGYTDMIMSALDNIREAAL